MARYRDDLPQRSGGIFLTDGGMETTLIFHQGIELPHFAAFVLLDSAEGRQQLKQYYASYLAVARDHGTGFVLDSPTWRANPDWGAKLGYDAAALKAINVRSIALMEELRAGWERPGAPCVISGAIGPRGDGYKAGNMDAAEAEDYHRAQIAAFAEGGADMVTAYTLNSINEAIGVARAAKARRIPAAISFTVETNGRLANGETLNITLRMAMIMATVFAVVTLSVAVSGFIGLRDIADPTQAADARGFALFWAFLGVVAIGLGSLAWWIERGQRNAEDSQSELR